MFTQNLAMASEAVSNACENFDECFMCKICIIFGTAFLIIFPRRSPSGWKSAILIYSKQKRKYFSMALFMLELLFQL